MAGKALILVDLQKEWLDASSLYYAAELEPLIEKINRLIDFCREKKYKIIFTRHIEPGTTGAFADGTAGAELISGLHVGAKDIIITKNKISPFYRTDLEKKLKNARGIVVSGALTNLCVRSLIEEAYDRELDITVIKDCCAAQDEEAQEFTFRDLKSTREDVEFINLEDFMMPGKS